MVQFRTGVPFIKSSYGDKNEMDSNFNKNGLKMYDKELKKMEANGCAMSSDGKLRTSGFLKISPETLKILKKNKSK